MHQAEHRKPDTVCFPEGGGHNVASPSLPGLGLRGLVHSSERKGRESQTERTSFEIEGDVYCKNLNNSYSFQCRVNFFLTERKIFVLTRKKSQKLV